MLTKGVVSKLVSQCGGSFELLIVSFLPNSGIVRFSNNKAQQSDHSYDYTIVRRELPCFNEVLFGEFFCPRDRIAGGA